MYYFAEGGDAQPIPVFPWHSLVPYLTNTQPSTSTPASPQVNPSLQPDVDGAASQPSVSEGESNTH